ncbi:MAG: glycoside hydrolase family 92 protein [Myxococcales bacterium]|nr:glycoside hydrolase family 92 protein [Myxococcales bacterium]
MRFFQSCAWAFLLLTAIAFLASCAADDDDDDSGQNGLDDDSSPTDDDDDDNDNDDDSSPGDDDNDDNDDTTPADVLDEVDPYIGTGGLGYGYAAAYPGAKYPHGMITLNPNTTRNGFNPYQQEFSGYNYSDPQIRGFVHTQLFGVGGPAEGNLLVMPMKEKPAGDIREAMFRSAFAKETEIATPGYYSAYLDDAQTRVELAAAANSGVERFTYAAGVSPYFIVWPSYYQIDGWTYDSLIEIDAGEQAISGWIDYSGAQNKSDGYVVYYALTFSRPFTDSAVWHYGGPAEAGTSLQAPDAGAYVGFAATAEPLIVKVAISFQSVAQARANLAAQVADADFDTVWLAARAAWEEELGKIEVRGGTPRLRRMFYTALYHTHMMPSDFTEANNRYFGYDGQTHDSGSRRYYTEMSLWDTYRTYHPFLDLLDPVRAADLLQSLTDMYVQGGTVPRWAGAVRDTGSMIETPAHIVFGEAYLKGVRDFDYQTAYEGCYAQATGGSARDCLDQYINLHFLPEDQCYRGVSHITEACRADAALSKWADALGLPADAALFLERSRYYRNHFDPATGFLRPKNADGSWDTPFFPDNPFNEHYVEGDAWQYTFCAEHDLEGLSALFGSTAAMTAKLEEAFQLAADGPPGIVLPGSYYWAGNEPDIFYPYIFAQAERPDLTQKWTRWIVATKFGDGPDGLPGNDDGGTMSSWLLFTMLGFFPLNGTDIYLIGSPLFDEAVLHLPDGDLIVTATDNSPENLYVQAVRLNGELLADPWFTHDRIAAGGTLEFEMGPQPAAAAKPLGK